MHAIFGVTEYQNVSGMRCSTDFAELPSTLMEYFAKDYRVVSQFARHYKTGDVIPRDLFEAALLSKKSYAAIWCQHNIAMNFLDQHLHSEDPLSINGKTSSISSISDYYTSRDCAVSYQGDRFFQSLVTCSVLITCSHPHFRFVHLSPYGGTFYSYQWCRALSSLIWDRLFASDPLNQDAGNRLRVELLAHGNGRDPWESISNLLGYHPSVHELAGAACRNIDDY